MKEASSRQVVRMAELEIDPTVIDAYKDILAEEIAASIETEPGVLMLCALSVRDSPASVRILEVYADHEAYEAHLLSPHFVKYKSLTASMVRSLRLVETDPILLAVKPSAASDATDH